MEEDKQTEQIQPQNNTEQPKESQTTENLQEKTQQQQQQPEKQENQDENQDKNNEKQENQDINLSYNKDENQDENKNKQDINQDENQNKQGENQDLNQENQIKQDENSDEDESDLSLNEEDYKQERDYEKGIGGPPPLYIGDEKKMKEKQKLEEEMANFDEDSYQLPPLEIPAHEKQLGSEQFSKKNYQEAAKHYSKALLGLNILIKDDRIADEEKMVWFIENIQVPCNSNLALCYINLKEYQIAIGYADTVVTLDQNNIKGLYRRALCNIHLGNFKEARRDLIKAQTIDPKNSSVINGFEFLKQQQEKQKQKMKNMSKKILGEMDYSKGQVNTLPKEVKEAQEKYRQRQNEELNHKQQQNQQENKNFSAEKLKQAKKIIQENIEENKKDFFYNLRIMLLTPLNIITDLCCKRKIPSQFFQKKKN
ncbi:hypothetical protein PPERSA_00975 [Pseudocohnilembus persalinus]|uniref:Uncharacterized protein n=1 Tax=Pseudocohnilembus persalinus TaxID=266149 RepID=A0A0V0R967_PSEPJ|nr:hypothetical protein PPERSA_00975 [Pseudocohnilembus persalinus]|eukprot:KRX10805.1 hypothetical protein PPERSA_00975 [Pseudocohnilembus persalinus]